MDLIIAVPNEVDETTGEVTELLYTLNTGVGLELAHFEKQIKELKEKEEELKQRIFEEMFENGILKIDTPQLTLTRRLDTTRESLDTKALKEELPDIYDTYVKISPVKGSLTIKVK